MSVVPRTAASSKKSCVLQASSGLRENRPTRTVITRSLFRSDSTHRKPLSLKQRREREKSQRFLIKSGLSPRSDFDFGGYGRLKPLRPPLMRENGVKKNWDVFAGWRGNTWAKAL